MHTTMQSAPFVLSVLPGCMAAREAGFGLPPGTHMTPDLRRGRPLFGDGAARRYRLLRQPTARGRIVLPSDTTIRVSKSLDGKAGVGELTLPRRIASAAIVRIDTVPSGEQSLRVNDGKIGRESAHLP